MKTIKCVECGKIKQVRFRNQITCSKKCARGRIKKYQKLYKKGKEIGGIEPKTIKAIRHYKKIGMKFHK